MKYYGSILEFTAERNNDLMRAYRLQLQKADFIVMPRIFERVANSPASRFWVSEERATVVISSMLAGNESWDVYKHKSKSLMSPVKREMFIEIYKRVKDSLAKNPLRPLPDVVAEIVRQPAPKFFLSPRTVGEYIYRIKNGWYERQFDRYRKYNS